MFTRKHVSLRTALTRALVRALVCTGMLAMSYMVSTHITTHPAPEGGASVMDGRTPAKGSPDVVLARMGDKCWQGDMPADVDFPGHVVYAQGDSGALVGGPRMVDIALDSIFKKPVSGLTVYAFCR